MKQQNQVAEITLRYNPKISASELPSASTAEEAYRIFLQCWNVNTLQLQEEFKVMLLNRANKVLGIVTTSCGGIAYLNSKDSIGLLREILDGCNIPSIQLVVATSIFEISHDDIMIEYAINAVKKMDNKDDSYRKFRLINSFFYLAKFNNKRTEDLIKSFVADVDFLISYNAKRMLGL